jgi:hypothetical protein
MTFWRTFWCLFVRSLASAPPCRPPPSARFYCYYRPPEVGKSPARLWSAVWCSTSHYTDRFPVLVCGECGGCWFTVGPGLSLFCSGPLALHWSGHVPKTGGLYSVVTHHTRYSLRGLGSFNLDLNGLLLLFRKWGLVLSHPVCDVPWGSRFV